jgi:transposase
VSQENRRRFLEAEGMAHPRPEAVRAELFVSREPFFFALDKQQVKYEMLRAHIVDGLGVSAAAEAHGYSRAAFYLIHNAFEARGMAALVDDKPGRRGPIKLSADITAFVQGADPGLSGAALAVMVYERFGVQLHRRTLERVRRR